MPTHDDDDEQRERLLAGDEEQYPPRRSPPRARRSLRTSDFSRPQILSRLLLCFSLAFFLYVVLFYHQEKGPQGPPSEEWQIAVDLRQSIVSSMPAMLFRDNLRQDRQYLTALYEGNFDRQVLEAVHTLYLAHRTRRVAVLPSLYLQKPLAPSMRFSDVFDLDDFQRRTAVNVVEWADLKAEGQGLPPERIACHSTAQQMHTQADAGRTLQKHFIDISRFPFGSNMQLPLAPEGDALYFEDVQEWIEDEEARKVNAEQTLEMQPDLEPPDDNLICLDQVYSLTSRQGPTSGSMMHTESPTWTQIANHLHFSRFWRSIAGLYLRQLMDLAFDEMHPPYIAVRLEEGRLKETFEAVEIAKAQLPLYRPALRVVIIQEGIFTNIDGQIPEGYVLINHDRLRTAERDGPWAPIILDRVIEAQAVAFVGSAGLSALRVKEWQSGLFVEVRTA